MDSQGVLSNLFSFVGKGHFLYVAGVSRSWRTYYTPKAAGEDGSLVTTFHDAVPSIPCLEYAFAIDLEFTAKFHPEKDDFRPGVYEWARQHGFPLYVWVATEGAEYSVITGVFSRLNDAKETAAERWNSKAAANNIIRKEGEWRLLHDGSRMPDRGRVCVKPFAIEEVDHANEISSSSLPFAFVCHRHNSLYHTFKSETFTLEGVFASKKLANESVKSIASDKNRRRTSSTKKNGFWSYTWSTAGTMIARSITYATAWECYLDGEGGKPGEFFKNNKRKRGVGR